MEDNVLALSPFSSSSGSLATVINVNKEESMHADNLPKVTNTLILPFGDRQERLGPAHLREEQIQDGRLHPQHDQVHQPNQMTVELCLLEARMANTSDTLESVDQTVEKPNIVEQGATRAEMRDAMHRQEEEESSVDEMSLGLVDRVLNRVMRDTQNTKRSSEGVQNRRENAALVLRTEELETALSTERAKCDEMMRKHVLERDRRLLLQAELDDAREELATREKELKASRERGAQLEGQYELEVKRCTQLEAAIEMERNNLKSLKDTLDRERDRAIKTQEQHQKIVADIEEAVKTEKELAPRVIQHLERELEEERGRVDALKVCVEHLELDNRKIKENDELGTEWQRLHERQMQVAQQEAERAGAHMQRLLNANQRLKEELTQVRSLLGGSNRVSRGVERAYVRDLEARLEAFEAREQLLKDEFEHAHVLIGHLQAENEALVKRAHTASDLEAPDESKEQVMEMNDLNETMRNRIRSLEANLTTFNSKEKTDEQQIRRLKSFREDLVFQKGFLIQSINRLLHNGHSANIKPQSPLRTRRRILPSSSSSPSSWAWLDLLTQTATTSRPRRRFRAAALHVWAANTWAKRTMMEKENNLMMTDL